MSNTNETSNGKVKWKVNTEISLGNLITVALIVVTFIAAWVRMDARVATLAKDVDAVCAAEKAHVSDPMVHYMVGSLAEVRLAEIKELVIKIDAKLDAHIEE